MADKPELFGTDGVRGMPGQYPLDSHTIFNLGKALGSVLAMRAPDRPLRVVLGEDTRESSKWISQAIAAGLRSSNVEVAYTGVITTPGVAFLAQRHGLAGGVMVSASHNPFEDNGIKILSSTGMKLAESIELEIEALLPKPTMPGKSNPAYSDIEPVSSLLDDYLEFLTNLFPSEKQFSKFRVAVDCGNGSASRVTPELMRRLGIEARVLNSDPNGRNINQECGSLHPEKVAEATRDFGADLGVAFDGDADRAIFSTREGRIADGDHVLYTAASYFTQIGVLKGGAVVGTLMTNLGLELALGRLGISLKRTPVGDKYVLEEMRRSGINLGGEPSGHVIFSDVSLAGDGMITLLQILRVLAETGKSLTELVSPLKQFPQLIRNVRVREKRPLESIPEVSEAVSAFQHQVGARGRVVVRYSGTEPLARVMVEAEKSDVVQHHADAIADAVKSTIGSI